MSTFRALSTEEKRLLNQVSPDLGERLDRIEDGGYWDRQKWANPAAAAAAAVLAATGLADGATTAVTTNITNPDFARKLSVTGNQGSAVGNVVITGTDYEGNVITETIVANGVATVPGTKAFATVTSVVLPARGAGGDTISVGITDALGLKAMLTGNRVMRALVDGVAETTAPTITFDVDELCKNTADLDTALNGAQAIEVIFLETRD